MLHISKEWEIPARLTVSQNSSIINCETVYRLQFMSNSHKKPEKYMQLPPSGICVKRDRLKWDDHRYHFVIALQICLLATVHESQLCQL